MKFIYSTLSLTLVAFAVADYNTVNDDITTLSNALNTLSTDNDAVVPGVAGVPFALQVQVDAVSIHNIIQQATRDANSSPPFGSDGSASVATSIINLEPHVQSSLQDVSSKSTTFGDLGPIVLSSLYQLKNDTDAFGKAVTAKLDPDFAAVAPSIIEMIDGYFNDAIVAYGGKGE
jgi:hypothetical protein